MFFRQITDSALAQNAYLIGCQQTGEAVVVDPERDVDRYLKVAKANGLRLTGVVETHIHADYLSGARELMEHHGLTGYFSSEGGDDWQFEWARQYPASVFLKDGDHFSVGKIGFQAVLTAGHTPEHLSFLVTDHGGGAESPMGILSGDFLFVGDVGRPDLLESAAGAAGAMEPAARALYASLRRTSDLSGDLQVWPGHGAGSACGKSLGAVPVSVLGYERRYNHAFREALQEKEADFVTAILDGQPEPPLYFARMKRENRAGPALLPEGRLPTPARLGMEGLSKVLFDGEHVILDLRGDRRLFMGRHLTGAIFAPLEAGKLPGAAGSYAGDGPAVILVVEEAGQVEEAVRQLVRIGIDRIDGWIPAGEALREFLENDDFAATLESVSTGGLDRTLAEHPGAAVLDVRSRSEYAASHVRGARHLPWTRLAARVHEVPAGHPLYVHCGSGMRAAMAVSYLAGSGFDVTLVDGAFEDIPDAIKQKD